VQDFKRFNTVRVVNTQADKNGHISAYNDGIYLVLDDTYGGFTNMVKFESPGAANYYAAERRNLNGDTARIELIATLDRPRIEEFISALKRYGDMPKNRQPGERLPYIESHYDKCRVMAEELEMLYARLAPEVEDCDAPEKPVYDNVQLEQIAKIFAVALTRTHCGVETAVEAVRAFKKEAGL